MWVKSSLLTAHQFPKHQIVVHCISSDSGHINVLKLDVCHLFWSPSLFKCQAFVGKKNNSQRDTWQEEESRTFLLLTTRTLRMSPNWEKNFPISCSPNPWGKCRIKRTEDSLKEDMMSKEELEEENSVKEEETREAHVIRAQLLIYKRQCFDSRCFICFVVSFVSWSSSQHLSSWYVFCILNYPLQDFNTRYILLHWQLAFTRLCLLIQSFIR